MPSKKLPVRSKIVTIVVGLVLAAFLIIFATGFVKSQLEIRKYSKLAQDFNTKMGGGYSTEEDVNCDLDESGCPSVRVTKNDLRFDLQEAQSYKEAAISFFKDHRYTISKELICLEDNQKINYCGFNALSKEQDVFVRFGLDEKSVDMTIMKQ